MLESPTPKFWFSASLRIMNAPERHEEITSRMGQPSHCHTKGDSDPDRAGKLWKNSIWYRESPLPEQQDIGDHLAWVADFAAPHEDYLRQLIADGARIDIYMSYCSDHDHCGFGLDPKHLEIFVRLGIRFEVSVMT
jgi:hypothetical protein